MLCPDNQNLENSCLMDEWNKRKFFGLLLSELLPFLAYCQISYGGGPGYESVHYGIDNKRPIYSERAHQALQNPQVSCYSADYITVNT